MAETLDITRSASPAKDLARAIGQAAPGAHIVYAKDWFLSDRALACAALSLFEEGRVDLVQQRIRSGRNYKFAYIAIKRRSPPAMTV